MNGDGRPGDGYVPPWDAPPPPLPPNSDPYPHGGYKASTEGPISYLPVLVDGDVVGYVWASVADDAASFLRVLAHPVGRSLDAAVAWSERLRQAEADGLTPSQALTRWVGAPADPQAGAIPADAVPREAASKRELRELANPGAPPDISELPPAPFGYLPDGTPLDRSQGWEPKIATSSPRGRPRYLAVTEGPVHYITVVKDGRTMGYLWASTSDNAASYERRGFDVEDNDVWGRWLARLDEAAAEGVAPLEAVRRLAGSTVDEAGAAEAREREAPSLAALKEIARAPEDS
ncbi:hypothetical protein RB614_18745 [Phytohabitans sp. ZYX-F-186]|uniref:Uncharacterized protein n=1 Tax=Phytohabitans maris TaxID=3071409 RepID=A0ABU0ZJK0_9ACTN|nr:hypothetical protein [Phytohabitans sp. ZYX-F-186]MDQ7906557.1 hypothetical protein [Phytohabitans sp. ZYX-F-186]